MKTTKRIPINLTFFVYYSVISFIGPMLFFSCTAMKVLTASYTLLDTNNVRSIKPGMTRDEVINIVGKPEGKDEKNEYDYYMYINRFAKKDEPIIQEAHIYYDDNNVVRNTTYQNMTKGGAKNDTSTLLKCFSSLEIGKSTFTQVKDILYPTGYNDFYLNGILRYKQLQYSTDFTMYMPLKNLPYVDTTMHEEGNVTYSLFFTDKGILTTPAIKLFDSASAIKSLSK